MYILFKAPPSKVLEWDHKGIIGQHRWLVRLWTLVSCYIEKYQEVSVQSSGSHFSLCGTNKSLQKELEEITNSVTLSLTKTRSFNVAIASLMKLSNLLSKEIENENVTHCATFFKAIQHLLIMLAPMAPFISEDLWFQLLRFGPKFDCTHESVHLQSWPSVGARDREKAQNHIIVQFQGRTKGKCNLPEGIPLEQDDILAFIRNHSEYAKAFAKGREIKQVVFLKASKVINITFQ